MPLLPEIDRGGLRLPDTRRLDAGQVGKRAIFRAEGDIAVGLGHHRRLAGDRIAQHAEAVLGADHEGVEAVEVVERCFQRLAERCRPRACARSDSRRRPRCRSRSRSSSPRARARGAGVVVGQRAVMHEALVASGREGMRAVGGDGQFGRHAGMADAVGPGHPAKARSGARLPPAARLPCRSPSARRNRRPSRQAWFWRSAARTAASRSAGTPSTAWLERTVTLDLRAGNTFQIFARTGEVRTAGRRDSEFTVPRRPFP